MMQTGSHLVVGSKYKVCANKECPIWASVMKSCKGCRAVWYCNKKCQIQDWNNHKSKCCLNKKNGGGV